MAKDEELNDVGGWLLFFIITLVIISPIFNLINIGSADIYTIYDILGIVSLFILSGIFLWMKKPYAVKFAKISLWITLISNILTVILLPEIFETGTPGLPTMFGYPIVWLLYLNYSKRVNLVYGKLKEKDNGWQIWPVISIVFLFLNPLASFVFSFISLRNISKNKKLKGFVLSLITLILSFLYYVFILYGLLSA